MSYELRTFHDLDAPNPLTLEDGIRLIGFHRRYGENHEFEHPLAVEAHAKEEGAYIIKVWLYDHGSTMYRTGDQNPFSCGWDSGFYGFLMFERSYIKSRGWNRVSAKRGQELEELAKNLMAEYTAWANGWMYGYEIADEDGEIVEGCGGFMDEEDALKEGEASLAALMLEKMG